MMNSISKQVSRSGAPSSLRISFEFFLLVQYPYLHDRANKLPIHFQLFRFLPLKVLVAHHNHSALKQIHLQLNILNEFLPITSA